MSVSKFVVKCGNFAVLVDLQVLPLGSAQDSSWWTERHKEEVSIMVQDTVEHRVKQFMEAKHQKGPQKPRRELTSFNPISIKGERLQLAAYFTKRHVNLRCVVRQQYRELRVFPERFVVCANLLDDAPETTANKSLDRMAEDAQSRSEYFCGPCETQDLLNSTAITKRNTLQKIAKQASARIQPGSMTTRLQVPGTEPTCAVPMVTRTISAEDMPVLHLRDMRSCVQAPDEEKGRVQSKAWLPVLEPRGQADLREPRSSEEPRVGPLSRAPTQAPVPAAMPLTSESAPPQARSGQEKGKRGRHSSQEDGEDAKRVCPGRAPVLSGEVIPKTHTDSPLTQASEAKGLLASKSCSAVESAETMLDEALLTSVKSGPEASLANNKRGLMNQTKAATSTKGLSVKSVATCLPVSSGPLDRKGQEEIVSRKSRLRRLKKA